MEGRAIARPDVVAYAAAADYRARLQWRAGQLPGLTIFQLWAAYRSLNLQWRAGQLPGLTQGLLRGMSAEFSLQWRAGQLPGLTRGADPVERLG